jgi:N-acetylglucosamine-6-phosphate deacetylase
VHKPQLFLLTDPRAADFCSRAGLCALTKAPLPQIVHMASLTPARLAGVEARCGSLDIGKRADMVILSGDLDVEAVYTGGERA